MGRLSRATGSDAKYGAPKKASRGISVATGGRAGSKASSGGVSAASGSDAKYGTPTQSPTYTVNGKVVENPNYVVDNASYDIATRAQSNVLPAAKVVGIDNGQPIYSNRDNDLLNRTQVATTSSGTFAGRAARALEPLEVYQPNTSTIYGPTYTPAPGSQRGMSVMYQDAPSQYRSRVGMSIFTSERINLGAYQQDQKRESFIDRLPKPMGDAVREYSGRMKEFVSPGINVYNKAEQKVSSWLPEFPNYKGGKSIVDIFGESKTLRRAAEPTFLFFPKSRQRVTETRNILQAASLPSVTSKGGDFARGIYSEFKERPIAGTVVNVGLGYLTGGIGKLGLTSGSAAVRVGTKAAMSIGTGWYIGSVISGTVKSPNKADYLGRETLKFSEFSIGAGLGARQTGLKRIAVQKTEVVGAAVSKDVTIGQTRGRMLTSIMQGTAYAENKFLGVSYKKPLKFVGKQEAFFKVGQPLEPFKMAETVTFYKGSKELYRVTTKGGGFAKPGEGATQLMTVSRTFLRRPSSGKIMTYGRYQDKLDFMNIQRDVTTKMRTPQGDIELTRPISFDEISGLKFRVGKIKKVPGLKGKKNVLVKTQPLTPIAYGRGVSREVLSTGDTRASIFKIRVITGSQKEILKAQKSGEMFLNKLRNPGDRIRDVAERQKIVGAEFLSSRRGELGSGLRTEILSGNKFMEGALAYRRATFTVPQPRIKGLGRIVTPASTSVTRNRLMTSSIMSPVTQRQPALSKVNMVQNLFSIQQPKMIQTPNIVSKMRQPQAVKLRQAQLLSQVVSVRQTSFTRTSSQSLVPPMIPPSLTPPPPRFNLKFKILETPKMPKVKRPRRIRVRDVYAPSIEAQLFRVKSPRINMKLAKTGLVIRPIKV